jgi:hypothetical protein
MAEPGDEFRTIHGQPPAGEQADETEEYCLDMFRRALLQQDPRARHWLQRRFHTTVLRWMDAHPLRQEAYHVKGAEDYTAEAFASFWLYTGIDMVLEECTLTVLLSYLQASLNSVVLESLRDNVRSRELPAQQRRSGRAKASDDGRVLWELLLHLFPDEREQRLAYLLFHCGLRVSEVVGFCPQEFPDMQETYRLKLRVLERFLQNQHLLHATNKS